MSVLKNSGAAKKAAVVLAVCVLGMAAAYGGLFLVGGKSAKNTDVATPAAAEAPATPSAAATPSEAATVSDAEQKSPFAAIAELKDTFDIEAVQEPQGPQPGRFNLAFCFPEGADQTDPLQSYGGKAFRNLYERDNSWNENVFGASSQKPVNVAGNLGIPRSSMMGKFNITDSNHNPDDPSTWVVGKWKKITLDIRDGNKKATPQSSNVKEILAMASVYTYYHDPEDHEAFEKYARALWNASHSYSMSVSEVYYDKDCLTKEAIEKAVAKGRVYPASKSNAEHASPSDAAETAAATEETQAAAETGAEAGDGTAAASEATESAVTGPGMKLGPGVPAGPGEGMTASGEAVQSEESSPAEESLTEGSAAEGSAAEEVSAEDIPLGDAPAEEITTEEETRFDQCPGHVDLTIRATVWNMDGKKNLFTLDKQGNDKANFNDRWQGWTEERIQEAKDLAEADWYHDYGLSVSLFSSTSPLTEAEIEEQLALLPEGLSDLRKALARTALGSIGRIPYYYGGKAVSPDYDKNNFYTVISPDYKGRIFRGLDCSGWLAWVYWNTTGNRLSESSTAGQIHLGRGIKRKDLRTGDIIIRAGNDETMGHVLMFLRWDESGKALCIHETGGMVNNVSFKLNEDVGASCRNLVD